MATTYPTLRLSGKEYVLVPKAEFQQRWQQKSPVARKARRSRAVVGRLSEEDRRDALKAECAVARLRAGKLRTISHSDLKRSLGL